MNKQMAHIKIEAKSKFGVLDGLTNKWLNPKDKDLLKTFFVGSFYDVELEDTTKNGKTYTNIVGIVPVKTSPAPVAKVADVVVFPKLAAPVVSTSINKDERILVQGLTQALLQSPVMSMVASKDFNTFVETNVIGLVEMVKRLSK